MEKTKPLDGKTMMNKLIETPEQADFANRGIKMEKEGFIIERVFQKNGNTSRQVDRQGEVRFSIQKYLFDTKDKKFVLGYKAYKNSIRIKLNSNKKEDKPILECIKEQFDDEISIFKLPKEFALSHYEAALKEINPPEEEKANYENFIYFRIHIELITKPKLILPNSVKQLYSFTEFYLNELRYYLRTESSTIIDCKTCINLVTTNVLKMSKKLRKEIDLPENKKLKEKINELMASVFINRYYLYNTKMLKMNDVNYNYKKVYEEFLKDINIYEKFFDERGKIDEKTLKFYVGYCLAHLNLMDMESFATILSKIEKLHAGIKNDEDLKKKFEEQINVLKNAKMEKTNAPGFKNKKTINALSNKPKAESVRKNDVEQKVLDYDWMPGINIEELEDILKKDIENMSETLKLKLEC